jgi:fibronectin type 3 domain-containing protein
MKTKLFLIVLLIVSTSEIQFAQQSTDIMSFAGPNGIFINAGIEIPFSSASKTIPFKYKIERSTAGQNNWTEVTQLSAPENFDSFIKNIYNINQQLKDSIPANELPLELIWKKAKQFERLDSMKYLGNPLVVRLALGVCYLDKQVDENKSYVYQISKLDKNGNILESFTTNEVSFPGKYRNNLLTIFSKETSEKLIRLTWKADASFSPARFKIFRRENFQGDFVLINPIKIYNSDENKIAVTIIDSTVTANSTYEYFILPLDYYQNEGMASDTVTLAAFSFNKIFPPYDIKVSEADSLGGLKISWKLDNKNAITSIKIFRSKYSDKEFEELSEVTGFDSVYIDRTAKPMVKYFYFLQLNDQFGEVPLQSAKVFGLYQSKEIPQPPLFLHSDSTSTGVKLVWTKPDEFVNVYHIYRNLGDDEILAELKVIQTSDSVVQFLDTSSTLKGNRVYYYSVRAENTSGNLSSFSDTVQVFPKVKTVINSPKQLKGYSLDGKVFLYWENLFEKDETIEGYKVFRRNADDVRDGFTVLFDTLLPPKQNNFVDTTSSEGNDYEYTVKAVDILGNESDLSSSIKINIPEIPILPPSGLTAVNMDNGIMISWQPPLQENIKEFKIFRYERGNEPLQIGLVNSDVNEFIDKSGINGNLYFYFVSAVSENGKESQPSEELGIRR